MTSDENQDFSTDTNPNNHLNKYGFNMQNFPPPMYPSMPIPGYFSPPPSNNNPLQELQTMGFKETSFTDTSGTVQEPFGFELKLDGIDKIFTGFGVGKKKARKAASQAALDYLYDATVLPEGIKIKTHRMHPMFQHFLGPTGQFPPPGYPMRPLSHQPPSLMAVSPSAPSAPPTLLNKPRKDTPLSILHDKYPEAQIRSQCTSIITIGEHEFSVTVPGNNSQESRMHASVAALKELEGTEFPEWDQRLERIIQNHRDPSSMVMHPVTLLLREYGSSNVKFKHEALFEPCTVSINEAGNHREYSSEICPTKKQAKYEVCMIAIRDLALDKKYPNILPCAQLDRKRRHTDTSETTANDDVTQLGYSIQTSMGIDEEQKQESVPIEEMPDPQSPAQPAVPDKVSVPESSKTEPEPASVHQPESEPTQDKKLRMDASENPAADSASDSPSLERRQQAPYTARYSRGGGRNPRGSRASPRMYRVFRGSQRYL